MPGTTVSLVQEDVGSVLHRTNLTQKADPGFLIAAAALTNLANIGNAILRRARLKGLLETQEHGQKVQDAIFDERAEACFFARSLETQAELLTRAMEYVVSYSNAAFENSGIEDAIKDDHALQRIRTNSGIIINQLKLINKDMKQAMGRAVQSACHSANSGEIVIQNFLEKAGREIRDAEGALLKACTGLFMDLVDIVLDYIPTGKDVAKGNADVMKPDVKKLEQAKTEGDVVIHSLKTMTYLVSYGLPKGLSETVSNVLAGALGGLWAALTTLAYLTLTPDVLHTVGDFLSILEGILTIAKGKLGKIDTMLEVFSLTDNVVSLFEHALTVTRYANHPTLKTVSHYIKVTIRTVSTILRLARTAVEMEREHEEQAYVRKSGNTARSEGRLLRSYTTCNALGTAWSLADAAGTFIDDLNRTVAALPANVVRTHRQRALEGEYERFVQERPGLAARILAEAVVQGVPGASEGLAERARQLAAVAPITDFAVARNSDQIEALEALGFVKMPAPESQLARFLICRGCGDSVVVGMTMVENEQNFKEFQANFQSSSSSFKGLRLPQDATLNFVQFPDRLPDTKELLFRLIAFAKVPYEAIKDQVSLPVLFDLREEAYALDSTSINDNMREVFRERTIQNMKSAGVEVLGWRVQNTKHSIFEKVLSFVMGSGDSLDTIIRNELGRLSLLTGRFYTAPPSGQTRLGVESLILPSTRQPYRFLAVTTGCGCPTRVLANRYKSGAPNIRLLDTLKGDRQQLQSLRCSWRYDVWLSTAAFDVPRSESEGQEAGLECAMAYAAKNFTPEVFEADVPLMQIHLLDTISEPQWYTNKNLSEVYRSSTAQANKAVLKDKQGPILLLDDDGYPNPNGIAVFVHVRPGNALTTSGIAPTHLLVENFAPTHSLVENFKSGVKAVLCSDRCYFADDESRSVSQSVREIVGLNKTLGDGERALRVSAASTRAVIGSHCDDPMVVSEGLAPSMGLDRRKELLTLEAFRSAWGDLVAVAEPNRTLNPKLAKRLKDLYETECDFTATVLLQHSGCESGGLSVNEHGVVSEVCGGAYTGEPPIHQYAVVLDFHPHPDANALLDEERSEHERLEAMGFVQWRDDIQYDSPEFDQGFFVPRKARSLRQRIYILRDPRVTTVSGNHACGKGTLWLS